MNSEAAKTSITEFSKWQSVRLFDVFVLGPLTIYGTMQTKPPRGLRMFFLAAGIAMIITNGTNYLLNEETRRSL